MSQIEGLRAPSVQTTTAGGGAPSTQPRQPLTRRGLHSARVMSAEDRHGPPWGHGIQDAVGWHPGLNPATPVTSAVTGPAGLFGTQFLTFERG